MLTDLEITQNYSQYREKLTPLVSAGLIEYLDQTDFRTAPASTRYHGSYAGGLCEHSLGVLSCLKYMAPMVRGMYTEDQLVRAALLHDICKADTYKTEKRNRKNEQGKWEQYDCWIVEDPYPAGHGSKSVALALEYGTPLTREEIMAVTHHMGAYGLSGSGLTEYRRAAEICPLVLLLHWADMAESNIRPIVRQMQAQ